MLNLIKSEYNTATDIAKHYYADGTLEIWKGDTLIQSIKNNHVVKVETQNE